MSSLLGLLNLGSSALLAQQAGVAVVGQNTANVNTPGYSRESVNLESLPGDPESGVVAGATTRASDAILSGRERTVAGDLGGANASATALDGLEQSLTGSSASDVSQAIASLFGSFASVAASPSDPGLRAQVVSAAQNVAISFNEAANAIASAQKDATSRISDDAASATQLAAAIAADNKAAVTSNDPTLLDRRDQDAQKLAQLVGGSARVDPDGMMRVVVGSGTTIVDGLHAAQVTVDSTGSVHVVDGTHSTDVTQTLTGGSIAGEISFRDGTAAQAASSLDQLASDLATKMNAVHEANAGQDGATGRDLFVAPVGVTGAAKNLTVNAVIVADPSKLAGAAAGAAIGDNQGFLALAGLANQNLAGNGTTTFVNQAIATIADVGAATQSAKSAAELQQNRSGVIAGLRSSLSGVSQDDEMAKLAAFQRGSQAAAQFVGVVNAMLNTILTSI